MYVLCMCYVMRLWLLIAVLSVLLLVAVVLRWHVGRRGMVWVATHGRRHWVRDRPGKHEVAEILEALETKVDRLVQALRQGPDRHHVKIQRLQSRWRGYLSETSPAHAQQAGYTEDNIIYPLALSPLLPLPLPRPPAFSILPIWRSHQGPMASLHCHAVL